MLRPNRDLSQSNAESASLPDLDLSSSWRNDKRIGGDDRDALRAHKEELAYMQEH